MYRSGLGLVVLLVACGGSEFSSQTPAGSSSGSGGGAGTGDTSGAAGDGSSSVSTGTSAVTSVVATGAGGGAGDGGSAGAGASTTATGGAAGKGGSGGASGSGAGGGAGTSDAGPTDSGALNCSALANEVGQKLAAAQACNPSDAAQGQCQDIVDGICCHVPVANKDSAQTRAYLAAVADYKSNCSIGCPAIPCSIAAPVCKANPDVSGGFLCQRSSGG